MGRLEQQQSYGQPWKRKPTPDEAGKQTQLHTRNCTASIHGQIFKGPIRPGEQNRGQLSTISADAGIRSKFATIVGLTALPGGNWLW